MTTIIGFKYFVEKGLPEIFPNVESFQYLGGLLANYDTVFNTLLFYVAWTSLGGGLILMTGTMSRTSREIIEAAHLDRVSHPLSRAFHSVVYGHRRDLYGRSSAVPILCVQYAASGFHPAILFLYPRYRFYVISRQLSESCSRRFDVYLCRRSSGLFA